MEQRSSRGHLQSSAMDSDDEIYANSRLPLAPVTNRQTSRRKDVMRHSHPKPPLTPNTGVPSSMSNPLLPSAPASPPTPAPSPTPQSRTPMWRSPAEDHYDSIVRDASLTFSRMSVHAKEAWLAAVVDTFDNHLLNYVHQLVSPRLKKDPFRTLPNELCFKVAMTALTIITTD